MQYLDDVTDEELTGLKTWLLPHLENATVAGFQTSFFTLSDAEIIVPRLARTLEQGGRLYAVLGDHPDQADPRALQMLVRLTVNVFPEQASAHLAPCGSWRNACAYFATGKDGCCAAYKSSASPAREEPDANCEVGITPR
jgi:hypothetical protein